MADPVVKLKKGGAGAVPGDSILGALALAVAVVDGKGAVAYVNGAAEQLFRASSGYLLGHPLRELLPEDNPLFSLIHQVRGEMSRVAEYGLTLESPRIGRHFMNVEASPLPEYPGHVILVFQERSIADKIDRQITQRGTARSMTAMAAMLAHEVKNPMSGIRGAAQLLEQTANDADRPLTTLIRDEVDRVCELIDRMGVFSDGLPLSRKAVNIHKVLNHVRKIAENGFGRRIRFVEAYDPSLPPVFGNRDQLVQVFLNLVKNAVEASPESGGEVVLSTAYRHGVRFALPGSTSRVHLPLMISVQDNGEGIPDDLRPHLFEPFVTTKINGSGLGLPLVAKIIDDHGGVIEFDSSAGRTVFRVMLPVASDMAGTDEEYE